MKLKLSLHNTAVVNSACKIPGGIGTLFAGSYANDMADQ